MTVQEEQTAVSVPKKRLAGGRLHSVEPHCRQIPAKEGHDSTTIVRYFALQSEKAATTRDTVWRGSGGFLDVRCEGLERVGGL